jgi:hypothetical protein
MKHALKTAEETYLANATRALEAQDEMDDLAELSRRIAATYRVFVLMAFVLAAAGVIAASIYAVHELRSMSSSVPAALAHSVPAGLSVINKHAVGLWPGSTAHLKIA